MTIDTRRVRVGIAIQHSPRRDGDPVYERLIGVLRDHFPLVVTDPLPERGPSPWRTYEACLRRTPGDVTHMLVVQDDVEVCSNFVAGVYCAVRSRPDQLLSFFVASVPQQTAVAQLQACERGDAWAAMPNREWTPTQALCWPVYLIPPLLRFADERRRRDFEADDEIVGRFLRKRGVYGLVSCPSLVEHAHHSSTSMRGYTNPGPHRSAVCWIGPEWDPVAEIDWPRGAR